MRALVIWSAVFLSAGGCRHAHPVANPCPPVVGEPGVFEERCPPGLDESCQEQLECPAPGGACLPGEPSILDRILGRKGCLVPHRKERCPPEIKERCAPEIHVTVPPPQVIVRREEKKPVAAPPPPPGDETLLVPTTVYVPYRKMIPTGPARMMPLNMVPGPPPPAVAPCLPPAVSPPACAPGGPACAPAPAGAEAAAQTIDGLNRRCNALENKIDSLIDALHKARPNR